MSGVILHDKLEHKFYETRALITLIDKLYQAFKSERTIPICKY